MEKTQKQKETEWQAKIDLKKAELKAKYAGKYNDEQYEEIATKMVQMKGGHP